MHKHFKQWLDANKGQYHISFNFIDNSPALKGHSTKKVILNHMVGSDYAMNGKVIWTRAKYSELTGCSYRVVRHVFDQLIEQHILIPIEHTSNYELDFGYLQRRLARKDTLFPKTSTGTECQSTGTEYHSTGTECTKTGTECTKTGTEGLHIDNTDIIDNNKSIISEGEDDILSSSTPKPKIDDADLELFLQHLDI